ncbi:MAG: ASPIC/UnbV domain-containing protein, partial [Acidobacteriota bacterium]
PELLENTSDSGFHWLGLRLHGGPANPLAIGARVVLRDAERRFLGVREVTSGGSFLSQPDLRLHFGLGALNGPVMAEIRWPDGCVQAQAIEVVDRYLGVRYNRESCGHRDSPRPRS